MILDRKFFDRDVLDVAPELVGKVIVRKKDGEEIRVRITETEAYRGEEDTACHACKGRTKRTEVLYHDSGIIYVYLCYGMHWLMNIVTGGEDNAQAVLIRAGKDYSGPAKLTKRLGVNGSFNDISIVGNDDIRIEDDGYIPEIIKDKRVGIDYATDEYRDKKWRFIDSDSVKRK